MLLSGLSLYLDCTCRVVIFACLFVVEQELEEAVVGAPAVGGVVLLQFFAVVDHVVYAFDDEGQDVGYGFDAVVFGVPAYLVEGGMDTVVADGYVVGHRAEVVGYVGAPSCFFAVCGFVGIGEAAVAVWVVEVVVCLPGFLIVDCYV